MPLDFAGYLRISSLLSIFYFWPRILNNNNNNNDSNTTFLLNTSNVSYLLFRLSLIHDRTYKEAVLLILFYNRENYNSKSLTNESH